MSDVAEIRAPTREPADMEPLRTVAAERADEAEAASERTRLSTKRVRSVIVGVAAVNCVLLGLVVLGALGDTAASPVMAAPPPAPEETPAAAAAQPTGSSGGASRASSPSPLPRPTRPAIGLYAPTGGLEDIFCRPKEGELEEIWLARIPQYCGRATSR